MMRIGRDASTDAELMALPDPVDRLMRRAKKRVLTNPDRLAAIVDQCGDVGGEEADPQQDAQIGARAAELQRDGLIAWPWVRVNDGSGMNIEAFVSLTTSNRVYQCGELMPRS